MRIAYIIPSKRKTGPIMVVYELVIQLKKLGHEIMVFYMDDVNHNCIDFPCATKRISIMRRIELENYDVVHSHCFRGDMYVFLHKPLFRTNVKRTLYVTTIHSFFKIEHKQTFNPIFAWVMTKIWIMFIKRHDKIAVLSKVAKDFYREWFDDSRMAVVYNSRSLQRRSLDDKEKTEILNFKARIEGGVLLGINAVVNPIKGIDLAIKTLQLLSNAALFVVGDGPIVYDLIRLAESLGVSERVYFAGYHEDAYRYLPYYDVCLVPSRSEGFCLSLLEAVESKCKVVISDIPIFKELYSDDEVEFFKTDDVGSLTNAIINATLTDKTKAAYLRYKENYSPDKFVEGYLNLYQDS